MLTEVKFLVVKTSENRAKYIAQKFLSTKYSNQYFGSLSNIPINKFYKKMA